MIPTPTDPHFQSTFTLSISSIYVLGPFNSLHLRQLTKWYSMTWHSLVAVKHEDSNAIQTDNSAQIQLRFSLMNRLWIISGLSSYSDCQLFYDDSTVDPSYVLVAQAPILIIKLFYHIHYFTVLVPLLPLRVVIHHAQASPVQCLSKDTGMTVYQAAARLWSPLACPSSTLSDNSNAFFLWVALLFAGIFLLLIAAGRSSSLALAEASFAALALVVGFWVHQ